MLDPLLAEWLGDLDPDEASDRAEELHLVVDSPSGSPENVVEHNEPRRLAVLVDDAPSQVRVGALSSNARSHP